MTARTFVAGLVLLLAAGAAAGAGPRGQSASTKTRLAVIGLDHDHVWGLLDDMAREPDAQLVAIAESNPELIRKARARVPRSVEFFSDYKRMLDAVKPAAVEVFGAKGSMVATRDRLLERRANSSPPAAGLEGGPAKLEPLEARFRSPIACFVDCVRRGKPIGPPLSAALNAQVNEILDAAQQSMACQCAVELREDTHE